MSIGLLEAGILPVELASFAKRGDVAVALRRRLRIPAPRAVLAAFAGRLVAGRIDKLAKLPDDDFGRRQVERPRQHDRMARRFIARGTEVGVILVKAGADFVTAALK